MPPGEQKNERESGVSKIVGATPEEERDAMKDAREIFENQSEKTIFIGDDEFDVKYLEREKTPEERQIIAGILEKMPEFIRQHGGKPVNVSENHIHILDISKLDEESQEKILGNGMGGHYNSEQFIYVFPDRAVNVLGFAEKIAHELIHFNSFQSQEKVPDAPRFRVRSRRVGLSMRNRKTKDFDFGDINEAVTEELAILFDKAHFAEIPVLAEEVRKREEFKKAFLEKYPYEAVGAEDILFVAGQAENIGDVPVAGYTYPELRREFDELVDNLFDRNKDKFQIRAEVFEMFVAAAMSGKILPVARLIEKTCGKGSFRKLGELSKSK